MGTLLPRRPTKAVTTVDEKSYPYPPYPPYQPYQP